jgi:Uma2 family endonuclease
VLAIEVADSSLRRDRDAKLPVYARCGVRELWIVELRRQRIHAFLEPKDGRYLRARVCTNDDRLSIASGGEIRVRQIFC